MPYINKVRINGTVYNNGNDMIDNLLLNFKSASATYEAINGVGKSFILQSLMQTIIPGAILNKKLPYVEIFSGNEPTQVAHVAVEWTLDEKMPYLYFVTGFCARKRSKDNEKDVVISDEAVIENNQMDYFTYAIGYNGAHSFDIDKMPYFIKEDGEHKRAGYESFKSSLKVYKKELEGSPKKIFVEIFGPREGEGHKLRDYKMLLSRFYINEIEWELLRQINTKEVNVATFFEKFITTQDLISNYIIPEILEKSYKFQTDKDFQSSDDRAKAIYEINDQLKNLASKQEMAKEYNEMIGLIKELVYTLEKLQKGYFEKNELEEKLCKVINYLKVEIAEYEGCKNIIEKELEKIENQYLDTLKNEAALYIKFKENSIKKTQNEYDKAVENYNNIISKRDVLTEKIRFAEAVNDYLRYKESKSKYEALRNQKENIEKGFEVLVKERNYYGNIYVNYIEKHMEDVKDKKVECTEERDEKKKKLASISEENNKWNKSYILLEKKIGDLSEKINTQKLEQDEKQNVLLNNDYETVIDYSDDSLEKYKNQLQGLSDENKSLYREINTDILLKQKDLNHKIEDAQNSNANIQESLNKKTDELVEFKNKEKEYLEIAVEFKILNQTYVSDEIWEKITDLNINKSDYERKFKKIEEDIKNLSNQKPLTKSFEMEAAFNKIQHKYGSASLGLEDIDSRNDIEKKELLENNILIPYSIVLSDSQYESFKNDTELKFSFGDYAFPVLSRSAVRERKELKLDFLQFTTKPLDLFINKELIEEERKKRTLTLEKIGREIDTVGNTISEYSTKFKIVKSFEEKYSKDFEKTVNAEISSLNEKLNKEIINLKELNKDQKNLNDLLLINTEKYNNNSNIIESLTEIVSNLGDYLKLKIMLAQDRQNVEVLENDYEVLGRKISLYNNEIESIGKEVENAKENIGIMEDEIKELDKELNEVLGNITKEELKYLDYLNNKEDYAKNKYKGAHNSIVEKNSDLKQLIERMEERNKECEFCKDNIINKYKYSMDFFENKDVKVTSNVDISKLQDEKSIIEEQVAKIGNENAIKENDLKRDKSELIILKNDFKAKYDTEYSDSVFNNISDLATYKKDLINEKRRLEAEQKKNKEKFDKIVEAIKDYNSSLDSALKVKSILEIKSNTSDISKDIDFIDGCDKQIKKKTAEIDDIKSEFDNYVLAAKNRFVDSNISNFIQELNDLTAPISLDETEMYIEVMSGDGGYIMQIQKELDEVDKSIESLRKIEAQFVNLYSQKCETILTNLKSITDFSKITIDGEDTSILKLMPKDVSSEKIEIRKEHLRNHLNELSKKIDSLDDAQKAKKFLSDNLTLAVLFNIYFNNVNRWKIQVYKFESISEHNRYMEWESATGSGGQSNVMFLMVAACIISYIRKLHQPNDDTTKKVLICDNPFGASGAMYLFKPLMKLLEVNNIQFICPGYRIPAELIGLFKINYQLSQKQLPNLKKVMVASLKGEKEYDDMDYYFSGEQISLLDGI